jgi:hypothetical protein
MVFNLLHADGRRDRNEAAIRPISVAFRSERATKNLHLSRIQPQDPVRKLQK